MSSTLPTRDPFITRPREPAPASVHTLHGVITLLAWVLYAWLWLPVITVAAWMLGIRTSYVELLVQRYEFDEDTFGILFTLAVVTTSLLLGWAEYNRHRFSGEDRRRAARDVEPAAIAEALRAPPDVVRHLASAKSVTLVMADDARPVGVHRHVPMSGR